MTERILTASQAAAGTAGRARSVALTIAGAAALAALTWVGSNIYIPLSPVPVTLQTLFVLLAGSVAARRTGVLGQGLYVGAGALGLPVFAGGLAGLGILAGPTGGYLLSFLVAPWVVSRIIARKSSLRVQVTAFSAGTAVIFLFGVTHLALFYTHDVVAALRVGLLPFVPGALFKIAAAVSIHRSYTALRERAAVSRGS